MSPGAYIFQRPFSRGLFLEGLIFGGAYLWREICVSKSIGLALQLKGNLPFLPCCTLYLRAISKYKPPPEGGGVAYIWWGDLTEGSLRYQSGGIYLEGLIHGGDYFRNFTVAQFSGTHDKKIHQNFQAWKYDIKQHSDATLD